MGASHWKTGYSKILKEKQYLKMIVASTISRFGDSLDSIAYGWMVYQITGSPVWLSLIFGVNALPTILFQPFAGVWVEYLDKKKLMVLCDLGRGVIIALTGALYLLGVLAPWHLLVLTFLNSTLEAFRMPAGTSVIPRILSRENYDYGMSLSSTISRISEVVGMASASAIIGFLGTGGALIIDAVTFLGSALVIATVRLKPAAETTKAAENAGYWKMAREGLRFFRTNHTVLAICVMGCLINALVTPAGTLMAAFAQETLGLGVEVLTIAGLCMTLSMGAGSFLFPLLRKRIRDGILLCSSVAVMALSYIMLSSCSLLPSALSRMLGVGISMAVLGLSVSMLMMVVNLSFMQNVPEQYLGRIGSLFNAMAMGITPISSFVVAGVVAVLAIDRLYVIMGVLMLLLAIGTALSRTLRRLGQGDEHEHEHTTRTEPAPLG